MMSTHVAIPGKQSINSRQDYLIFQVHGNMAFIDFARTGIVIE